MTALRFGNTVYKINSSNLPSFTEAFYSQIPSHFSRNVDIILGRREHPKHTDGTGISHYLEISHLPFVNELSVMLRRKKSNSH